MQLSATVAVATAALLASGCTGIQLLSTEQGTCEGEQCLYFMDDVHWNASKVNMNQEYSYAHHPYRFRNVTKVPEVYSVTCKRGSTQCKLMYSSSARAVAETVPKQGEKNVLEAMLQAGTDKVTSHNYSPMYQAWLGPLSKEDVPQRFTFVEVGFAKGHSARAWSSLFSKGNIHEFESHCDQDWNAYDTKPEGVREESHRDLGYCKLHCGDGTSLTYLEESLKDEPRPLVVIDDGEHTPWAMRHLFLRVWPKVQRGGMFFIEDLATSYTSPTGFVETNLKPIIRDMMGLRPSSSDLFSDVELVECREEICLVKKADE